ncbi:MAG TPA: hypothetical protein PL124_11515, partial [Candidatus Cloacimonadota bacterium]|nr:hypothetical protein [Candidatus Cloacimonadota bacterium]
MEMLQVQESVMLPSRQWDRGTGTADFAMARGFVLNVSSRALSVKLKEDAAGVNSYYVQGVQYVG